MLSFRVVRVPVQMNLGAVFVNVGVVAGHLGMGGGKFLGDPGHRAGEIEDAEKDQHQADGKFHGQAYARGDGEVEKDDPGAYDQNGYGMAYAPEDADQAGFPDGALAAHDGGNRDNVVGVGGMAHAEYETNRQNCESAHHRKF